MDDELKKHLRLYILDTLLSYSKKELSSQLINQITGELVEIVTDLLKVKLTKDLSNVL